MSMRNTLLCTLACLAAGCTTRVPVPVDQYSAQQKVVMTFKNDDVIQGRIVEGAEVHYTNEGRVYRAHVTDIDNDRIVLSSAHLLSDDSPTARQAKLVKLNKRRAELAESSNPAPVPIDQIRTLQAELDTVRKMIAADRAALEETQTRASDARMNIEALGSASGAAENDLNQLVDVRDRLLAVVAEYQTNVQSVNDERSLLIGAGIPPVEVDTLRVRFSVIAEQEGEIIRTERQYREMLSQASIEAEERERLARSQQLQSGRNKQKLAAATAAYEAAKAEQDSLRQRQRDRDSLIFPLVQRTRYNDSFELNAAYVKWIAMKEQAKGYLRSLERQEDSYARWRSTNDEAAAIARKWGVGVEENQGVPIVPIASLDELVQRMGRAGRSRGTLATLEAEVLRLVTEIAELQARHDSALERMENLLTQSGVEVASAAEAEKAIPAFEERYERYLEWKQLNDEEIPKYERLLLEVVPYAGPERVRLGSARLAVVDTLAPVVLPMNQIESIEEIRMDKSKTSLRVGFWGYAAIVLGMLVSERS